MILGRRMRGATACIPSIEPGGRVPMHGTGKIVTTPIRLDRSNSDNIVFCHYNSDDLRRRRMDVYRTGKWCLAIWVGPCLPQTRKITWVCKLTHNT